MVDRFQRFEVRIFLKHVEAFRQRQGNRRIDKLKVMSCKLILSQGQGRHQFFFDLFSPFCFIKFRMPFLTLVMVLCNCFS